MRLVHVLTPQEDLRHFSVLLPPVRPERVLLAELRGVTGDPAYDLIRRVEKPSGFILTPFPCHEPVSDALKPPCRLLFDHFSGNFHIHPRDRHLIVIHLIKDVPEELRFEETQRFLDDAHIFLKPLDEVPQIFHQLVLKYKELLCPHHFLCLHAVQVADIVLIVLIQPDEIIVQVIPPRIDRIRILPGHLREAFHIQPDPLQQRGLQGRPLYKQILKPDHQTLDLHAVL